MAFNGIWIGTSNVESRVASGNGGSFATTGGGGDWLGASQSIAFKLTANAAATPTTAITMVLRRIGFRFPQRRSQRRQWDLTAASSRRAGNGQAMMECRANAAQAMPPAQSRPRTMAPTKASDRYAVRVLNVPNVVMGHLPILRAFIPAICSTVKAAVRSRKINRQCRTPLPDLHGGVRRPTWLKFPEINALKSL